VPQMRGSLNCILHTAYRCKSSLISNVGSKYPKSVLQEKRVFKFTPHLIRMRYKQLSVVLVQPPQAEIRNLSNWWFLWSLISPAVARWWRRSRVATWRIRHVCPLGAHTYL